MDSERGRRPQFSQIPEIGATVPCMIHDTTVLVRQQREVPLAAWLCSDILDENAIGLPGCDEMKTESCCRSSPEKRRTEKIGCHTVQSNPAEPRGELLLIREVDWEGCIPCTVCT